MGKHPTKALNNIYCQARLAAAKYNDKLMSREGASEYLGISKDSLTEYELGLCKFVPVDKVVIMSEGYNCPELLNHYCSEQCPIGSGRIEHLELKSLESHALRLANATKDMNILRDELMQIAEDGKIDDKEKQKFSAIIYELTKIENAAAELKLWAEKNVWNVR